MVDKAVGYSLIDHFMYGVEYQPVVCIHYTPIFVIREDTNRSFPFTVAAIQVFLPDGWTVSSRSREMGNQ